MVESSPISMPPIPARPIAVNETMRPTRAASMPLMSASTGLSATARIVLPVRVKVRKAKTAAITATEIARFSTCCGPMRTRPKRQSRWMGRS